MLGYVLFSGFMYLKKRLSGLRTVYYKKFINRDSFFLVFCFFLLIVNQIIFQLCVSKLSITSGLNISFKSLKNLYTLCWLTNCGS